MFELRRRLARFIEDELRSAEDEYYAEADFTLTRDEAEDLYDALNLALGLYASKEADMDVEITQIREAGLDTHPTLRA